MTSSDKHELFSPYKMGSLTLKNRVVLAPMTRARAGAERLPNALMAKYYAQRSGAGLLITEATAISEMANGWSHTPGIYTEEQVAGWKLVTAAAHARGTAIFLQLWHTGRASHTDFHKPNLPVAPSAIAIEGEQIHTDEGKKTYEVPRALETDEIPGIVEEYRKAAQCAKEAGFDGIEIHSANGYLLDQFLQSKSNKRTDRYGGTVENRYRFLKEVVEATLTVWDADRVAVRLAPNGVYNNMGSPDFRETFLYVAEQLSTYGLAYLHVLDGLAFGFHELGAPITLPDLRKVFQGTLMGNCGYDQKKAEAAIRSGDADLIAFGRPYIANPDLAERFEHGWELSPEPSMSDWYSFTEKGYTDFPVYEPAKVAK